MKAVRARVSEHQIKPILEDFEMAEDEKNYVKGTMGVDDNKTVFRSNVDYVCISLDSYKPKKMPDLFKQSYKVTI